jgi:hypothetical protein
VTVETGGLYLMKIVRGRDEVTEFQEKFARAGHAHAGVLLVLALVCQPFADATDLSGPWAWVARTGVAVSALLMPGGVRRRGAAGLQPGDPGHRAAQGVRATTGSGLLRPRTQFLPHGR